MELLGCEVQGHHNPNGCCGIYEQTKTCLKSLHEAQYDGKSKVYMTTLHPLP